MATRAGSGSAETGIGFSLATLVLLAGGRQNAVGNYCWHAPKAARVEPARSADRPLEPQPTVMIKNYQVASLSQLITSASTFLDDVPARFGHLSATQLNWQPAPDRWSVAQCLEHLVVANEGYFPIFERALSGEGGRSFWQRLPWLPGLWGRWLIKAVSPVENRKLKAPKIFRPSSSSVDGDIVHRFVDRQNRVIQFLRAAENVEAGRIVIPSPVTGVITYSLLDACRVVVAHEERHLQQAARVTESAQFPG